MNTSFSHRASQRSRRTSVGRRCLGLQLEPAAPSCSQCTSVRASSAAAVCVTSMTRQKMFRAHSACARRHAALWRHAACGSTQASAAQRRLMLTPLHAFGRLGRTTACPFDVITMSCQHKSCRESREKHDGTKLTAINTNPTTSDQHLPITPLWRHDHAYPLQTPAADQGQTLPAA